MRLRLRYGEDWKHQPGIGATLYVQPPAGARIEWVWPNIPVMVDVPLRYWIERRWERIRDYWCAKLWSFWIWCKEG